MLTTEDREEIKRLVGAMIAESGPLSAAQIRDLMADEGFTELTFMNPKTGETRVIKASLESGPIVDVLRKGNRSFRNARKSIALASGTRPISR